MMQEKGSRDTSNASNETTSATNTATTPATSTTNTLITRPCDTYVYVVGILAVLTIVVYVFFAYSKKVGQVIHEQPIKPKRHHML